MIFRKKVDIDFVNRFVLGQRGTDVKMGDGYSERRCCGCSHRIYHHGRV